MNERLERIRQFVELRQQGEKLFGTRTQDVDDLAFLLDCFDTERRRRMMMFDMSEALSEALAENLRQKDKIERLTAELDAINRYISRRYELTLSDLREMGKAFKKLQDNIRRTSERHLPH